MTLKVVSDNGAPPQPPKDDMKYYTYSVSYFDKEVGEYKETVVEGYPMILSGFFSFVKIDDDKNTYSEAIFPIDSINNVTLVK